VADKHEAEARAGAAVTDRRELPYVKEALASISEGGYPAALARCAYLLKRKGEPLPLKRFELKQEMIEDYRDLLPDLSPEQWRRIRGEQEIICRYEPDKAIETLPKLLSNRTDRKRFVTLAEKLLADKRIQAQGVTDEQARMFERIRGILNMEGGNPPRLAPVKKSAG